MRPLAPTKKLLLTGASGFLGWNIGNQASPKWKIYGVAFSHHPIIPGITILQTDLSNFKELKNIFHSIRPEAVMHAAALTDPNFCQLHRPESYRINVELSIQIAGLCADHRIPCIFTSSDLVFDGLHPPYSEGDPVCPVNYYGEQKVLAEEGMAKQYPEVTICRLPLMFGDPGPVAQNFLPSMVKAMKGEKALQLFIDELRTPVSGKTAAQGLFLAMEKVKGIVHLGGLERISRYDLGQLLKNMLGFHQAVLIPCHQKDLMMPAPRPSDVSLNSGKARSLGFKPPPLIEDLKECLISMGLVEGIF